MSKKVFYICLLFFVLLEAYGIYYYELRTQWETCTDTIWSCLVDHPFWLPTPMYRYAHILNKVFFVLSFPFHVPFKAIAVLCNVNDLLFYLGVAMTIVWFTRRYDYAAAVLAAPVFLHGFGYYDIINETWLGGSMLILFVALHKYMQERLLKTTLLVVSMFFVIWGHPDMLLTLCVFLPFIYYDFQTIKCDLKMVLFIAINVVVRTALLADYDMGKINLVNIHSLYIHNLIGKGMGYANEFWFIAIPLACMVYVIIRSENKWMFVGLLVLPVCLLYVDAYHKTFGIPLNDPNVMKYLYPVHLFALLQSMIFIHTLPVKKFRWGLFVLFIILYTGITKTLSYHNMMTERALVLKTLNTYCAQQDSTQSKWYLRVKEIPCFASNTLDLSNEGLVFSVRAGESPHIHLVWADEETVLKLDTMGEDQLFSGACNEFAIRRLDTLYLDIRPGPYKKLLLDSDQINFLKPYMR